MERKSQIKCKRKRNCKYSNISNKKYLINYMFIKTNLFSCFTFGKRVGANKPTIINHNICQIVVDFCWRKE